MFEGQIDRRGEREELPKEILFESEQELLKRIHEIKKELKETEWSESPPPKVTQQSFLRTALGEDGGHSGFNKVVSMIPILRNQIQL